MTAADIRQLVAELRTDLLDVRDLVDDDATPALVAWFAAHLVPIRDSVLQLTETVRQRREGV